MDAFVIRNGKAPAAKPAAPTETAPAAVSVAGTKRKHESDGVQKGLADRIVEAIRRTEHTERGRPFTTVEMKMMAMTNRMLLLAAYMKLLMPFQRIR